METRIIHYIKESQKSKRSGGGGSQTQKVHSFLLLLYRVPKQATLISSVRRWGAGYPWKNSDCIEDEGASRVPALLSLDLGVSYTSVLSL